MYFKFEVKNEKATNITVVGLNSWTVLSSVGFIMYLLRIFLYEGNKTSKQNMLLQFCLTLQKLMISKWGKDIDASWAWPSTWTPQKPHRGKVPTAVA